SGPISRDPTLVPLPAESTRSLLAREARAPEPRRKKKPESRVLPLLLTMLALSASLIGASSGHIGARGPRVALGAIVLAFALELVHAAGSRRKLTLRALVAFAPLPLVVALAVVARAPGALPTVGLVTSGFIALRVLSERLHHATTVEIQELVTALEPGEARQSGESLGFADTSFVSVDGVVTAGHAELRPNGARAASIAVGPGHVVFAGGRLVRGEITVRVLRAGPERFVARLFGAGTLHMVVPTRYQALERLLLLGTVLASVTVGLFAWVSREEPWLPFLVGATVSAIVAMLHRVEVPRLMWARGVLGALEHGVAFPSFQSFDRASFVDQVVLSGRGVVFAGAPAFVELSWIGAEVDVDRILAEVAGAEAASTHPLGSSLAAEVVARGAVPESMRRVQEYPGLGVVARTRSNHNLVIGNRELLLRHAISVAGAEARTAALEEERKELLYIARDGRLVAYAVFEDGVKHGCFEAVQAILGAGMEPVMLSGSSQAVCEATGRELEIEHVRAEVLPEDRAGVVRSLIESGRVVGMVGTLPRDEDALLEADVAIAFGAADTRSPDALARAVRDDLPAAVSAIATARRTRERLGTMVLVALLPPLICGLAAGFGLCSPALMP
ncbi:MAG: cation-translocating P-type ATPase, partial [Proteobacteria bacterium]